MLCKTILSGIWQFSLMSVDTHSLIFPSYWESGSRRQGMGI